jgi:site-specific DNA-methyltransferase (adenine-specific)
MRQPLSSFSNGKLYLGDCLEVLPRLVQSRVRFDLVYLDPPFNTGRAHGARISTGGRARGKAAYDDQWGGLDGFLEMLAPRLECLRPLLSDRASVWLHLDYRAVHDAKVLCDHIFNREAFQGEVIWVPGNGARRRSAPSVTHQTLLIYAPSGQMIFRSDDPLLREPYADLSLSMHFRNADADGRQYRERQIAGKKYRYYADSGRRIGSVWTDCPAMRANTPLVKESTGYPTQKPERLLERILRIASDSDSAVLDPMCGSGTTLAVAARLKRRFVGIDRSELAYTLTSQRLAAGSG